MLNFNVDGSANVTCEQTLSPLLYEYFIKFAHTMSFFLHLLWISISAHPSMPGTDHFVIVYSTRTDISNNGNTNRKVNKVGAMVNTSGMEIHSHPLLHHYLSEPPHT